MLNYSERLLIDHSATPQTEVADLGDYFSKASTVIIFKHLINRRYLTYNPQSEGDHHNDYYEVVFTSLFE